MHQYFRDPEVIGLMVEVRENEMFAGSYLIDFKQPLDKQITLIQNVPMTEKEAISYLKLRAFW
jgi:hypothetical protein